MVGAVKTDDLIMEEYYMELSMQCESAIKRFQQVESE